MLFPGSYIRVNRLFILLMSVTLASLGCSSGPPKPKDTTVFVPPYSRCPYCNDVKAFRGESAAEVNKRVKERFISPFDKNVSSCIAYTAELAKTECMEWQYRLADYHVNQHVIATNRFESDAQKAISVRMEQLTSAVWKLCLQAQCRQGIPIPTD